MNIILETERLILRNFSLDDAALIYELNKDPDVTRYTGDPVTSIEQAEKILRETILPQYTNYNHGRWVVLVKPGLEFIGWCGLKARPERNEIDLGYRFLKKSWGKGYATEAAIACLEYGFKSLGMKRIVGRAMPDNIASLKVLEKCGMRFICNEIVDEHSAITYEAINPFIS